MMRATLSFKKKLWRLIFSIDINVDCQSNPLEDSESCLKLIHSRRTHNIPNITWQQKHENNRFPS